MTTDISLIVSQMCPKDRKDLRALIKTCWLETYEKELGATVTSQLLSLLMEHDLAGLVPSKDERVLFAKQQNLLCGSVISAAWHATTYLWGFYVLPDFQRRGIGTKLLLGAIKEHDPKNMVELTVLNSSHSAKQFYKYCGFHEVYNEYFEILDGIKLPAIKMNALAADIIEQRSFPS